MSRTAVGIPTIFAFKPRQVLLSQLNMKPQTDSQSTKALALEPEQRTLLHRAVALYLDRNGFSKSLKKFRSEAHIEKDFSQGIVLNLEEMCYKYLMKCLKNSKGTEPAEVYTICEEADKKSKEKKKKNKEKSIGGDLESNHIAVAANSEDADVPRDSQAVDSIALKGDISLHEEKVVKSKSKKKKGGQHSSDENLKQPLNGSVNENDGIKTVHENNSNESSKKRKRMAVVENDSHPVNEKETEDLKRRKVESSNGHDDMQSTKVDASVETDVNAASQGTGNHHDELTNGNVEKTSEKISSKKTPKKQANGSAEPKTVNAFQRVKIDDVVFADDRLADNSYWSKGGAEVGFGAKAQEVLGQVKGRDFRHEKTKKKRGTYRGGVIDLQSHSVKFNYSDDD